MVVAFIIDMSMVLYIELTRDAIKSAGEKMGALMIVHICMSLAVIVLYFWQIVTGIKKAKGQRNASHARAGVSLLLLRLGNLITSIMVMGT